jgi:hypothetical protein
VALDLKCVLGVDNDKRPRQLYCDSFVSLGAAGRASMVGWNTPVQLSVGKIITAVISGCITLCLGFWAIAAFTVGGIREDVSAIRKDVGTLQSASVDSINRANDISAKLNDQIAGLRIDFTKLSDRLDGLSGKIDNLNTSITKFQSQLNVTYAAWRDPKFVQEFADNLKKAGIAGPVVIVPFSPSESK